MASNTNLKMKITVKPTFKERVLFLLCQPILGKMVTYLPIPRRWKVKILHKQVMTLTKIALNMLKRGLANVERQEADLASQEAQSDDVNTTSSNWEKQENVGDNRDTFRFRA